MTSSEAMYRALKAEHPTGHRIAAWAAGMGLEQKCSYKRWTAFSMLGGSKIHYNQPMMG